MAREPPAAFGLALPGLAASVGVSGRGLTQQRCALDRVLKVGMSPAVPLPMLSDRRSFVVIIGVDPHKRTHTASALEPGTHRVLATLQIDATLAGYRQLARWAARFETRRWERS